MGRMGLPLYVRIWLAVVVAVATLTFLVGWAWRMAAEPPLREIVVRDTATGEVIGSGVRRFGRPRHGPDAPPMRPGVAPRDEDGAADPDDGPGPRGPEFTTMVRPWDASYQFAGRYFARPEDAPVAWVGDNRRDWVGLADALDSIFRSARKGYVVVGSDIGGYLDRDDKDLTKEIPFDQDNFARWTAVGALTPFKPVGNTAVSRG